MGSFLMPEEAVFRAGSGGFDEILTACGFGGEALPRYRKRTADAVKRFAQRYGDLPVRLFSVPGRTELGGNHTDHQRGCVLAGGINLDILAVAAKTDGDEMCVQSEGFAEDCVSLRDLTARPEERGTSAALLRGTAARLSELGVPVGGFCAYTVSDVLTGSGLSSSAAYEVLLGTVMSDFFAGGALSPETVAQTALYAENRYFGKPCGLMDQMACAAGGVCEMDFADPAQPRWARVPLDLRKEGYALCILDCGADHADLTPEYAAIPEEMRRVAAALGGTVLREIPEERFLEKLPQLREQCGDRAVLRAMHFYAENERAQKQAAALRAGDFAGYLRLVQDSGDSSLHLLQDIIPTGYVRQQAAAFALALCRRLLGGRGAYRIHGGGFAGTVQAYVPLEMTDFFRREAEAVLGTGACHFLQIRPTGPVSFPE